MKKVKHNLLFIFFLFSIGGILAQETSTTSGGQATGNGTVSYTVGQILYNFNKDTNYNITTGVQQIFEILVVLGSPEFDNISLKCMVYPNPTTDFIFLSIENFNAHNYKYSLYDLNGKNINTNKIIGNKTMIEMKFLREAIYFLKVYNTNNDIIKIFKTIKN